MDLARELAVCQLHGREGGIGPVLASLGEDGGVEEVVVAEVGVGTTTLFISIVSASMEMGEGVPETGVVLEEVVDVHLVAVWSVCHIVLGAGIRTDRTPRLPWRCWRGWHCRRGPWRPEGRSSEH